MDVRAELVAPCGPEELFAWVAALDHYPVWHDLVVRVDPTDERPGDPGPAHVVELRGRIGPLARSKALRMVRSRHVPPTAVRFERAEDDDRDHSSWVLEALVDPGDAPGGSRLTMDLHYGGGLFGPVLERALGDAIERSRRRLLELVRGGEQPPR